MLFGWRRLKWILGGIFAAAAALGLTTHIGDAAWEKLNPYVPVIGDSGPPGLIDALDGALVDAQLGRQDLQKLLTKVEKCQITPSAAAQEAQRIETNLRKSVADSFDGVSPEDVEHGPRLKQEFLLAMSTSAKADEDYRNWVASVPGSKFSHNSLGQCGPTVSGANQTFQQAFAHDSDDATRFKAQFIALYNPIAKTYDLKQWSQWMF